MLHDSIQIDVPLALIPCDNCKSELSKEGRQSDLDYHMTKVDVNSDSDEGVITVPIDVQRLLLKKIGKGEYRVNAVLKTVCPSCQEFRQWTYQFQAPTVFLKSNCHCRVCGSLLEIASDDEFEYVDDGKGSWEINASALLVCPNCKNEWMSDTHIQMPEFKQLQKVDSYDVQYHSDQNLRRIMKILFVAADPTDASRLRLQKEFAQIKSQLESTRNPGNCELTLPALAVRVRDLSKALLEEKPQIVHFSGHGSNDGELCFEDDMGKIEVINPDGLASLFRLSSRHVECVVLNACYSALQAKGIAQHIKYVIGMDKAIPDTVAIDFSIGFYQAMGSGEDIPTAYDYGCTQIQLHMGRSTEHQIPILLKKAQ